MGDKTPAPPLPLPPAPAKVYYDGCPGCAMDRKKETQSGVPYKELLFVATTTFASGTSTYYYILSLLLLPFLYRSIHSNCHPACDTEARHTMSSDGPRKDDRRSYFTACLPATLLFDLCILYQYM
jgi:hypothetical protein